MVAKRFRLDGMVARGAAPEVWLRLQPRRIHAVESAVLRRGRGILPRGFVTTDEISPSVRSVKSVVEMTGFEQETGKAGERISAGIVCRSPWCRLRHLPELPDLLDSVRKVQQKDGSW